MSAYDLVQAAKRNLHIQSDNALAVLMGIDNQNISNWKNGKGNPNGETALYLAELADLKPSEAKKILRNGFIQLSLLKVTAFASIVAMTPFIMREVCILCKIKTILMKFRQTRIALD